MARKSNQLTIKTESSPQHGAPCTALLGLKDFGVHLKALADEYGGNAELGRRLGVSGQYIDLLIAGKRTPGPKMLKAIGGRRLIMIEINIEGE